MKHNKNMSSVEVVSQDCTLTSVQVQLQEKWEFLKFDLRIMEINSKDHLHLQIYCTSGHLIPN